MPARSPSEAVDAFVGRLRRTLQCAVKGTVFGSGSNLGRLHSVTLCPDGQDCGSFARLRTHQGEGEILFEFVYLYAVVHQGARHGRGEFEVRTSFYQYNVLDREQRELVAYHWEPEGISPIRTPHVHMPVIGSIVLPQHPGSAVASAKTHLGKMHMPTGRVSVEDIVEMLIREFAVDPQRADWMEVLQDNRPIEDPGA